MNLDELEMRKTKYFNSPDKDFIGGTLTKEFFRIDDDEIIGHEGENLRSDTKEIADSVLFRELYESLMSGKSSYCTYLNGLFLNEQGKPLPKTDIYVPKYVSVLEKIVGTDKWLYAEVVGSRLANLMRIDTVYNLAPCFQGIRHGCFIDYKLYSVDYVPYGYETMTLYDMGFERYGYSAPLSTFVENIRNNFASLATKYGLNPTQERMDNLINAFEEQYLFKRCMCGDTDFDVHNIAILFNPQNGDFRLSPLFDMEGLLGHSPHIEQRYLIRKSVEFVAEQNSHMLQNFIVSANKLCRNKSLKNTMFAVGDDMFGAERRNDWYQLVKENINHMSKCYNSYMADKEEKLSNQVHSL